MLLTPLVSTITPVLSNTIVQEELKGGSHESEAQDLSMVRASPPTLHQPDYQPMEDEEEEADLRSEDAD